MNGYKLLSRIVIILIISTLTNNIYGQKKLTTPVFDTSKTYKIELTDESEFIGKYLSRDSVFITIKTSSIPKIDIPVKKIKSINIIEAQNMVNGVYWFPNPNPTRYLFGPSAYNLKKGEGYYQNTYLFINSVNYGITDNFSIGGGLELITTFSSSDPIFFLTPKVGFEINNNFHLGAGIMFVAVGSHGSASLLYSVGTYGSKDHNVTGGLGWGFIDGEFSSTPFITFSGMTRISKRAALISENWLIPTNGYYGIFSYGVRFFGEKLSVDLAFLNNSDIAQGIRIGIPYVDFVVKF